MSDLHWERVPALRRPVVVFAFDGWFDAGEAATGAVEWLRDRYDAQPLARIDAEEHFDFQQQRPEVSLDDHGIREIVWPDTRASAVPLAEDPHDLVLVSGVEPHLGWRQFVEHLVEVVELTGAELVVTLGAMASGVPHTRPPQVTGSSSATSLAETLGLARPTYEGPTGVVGVLHEALDRREIPAISLRVSVPHYLGGSPNPRCARALLEHLERVTGLVTGFVDLDDEVDEWSARVDAAVEADPDVVGYVAGLEEEHDRAVDEMASSIDLAAELERFLRDRND
ncbi:MAG: PAC2 family protein [Actinomycetota bacterium]